MTLTSFPRGGKKTATKPHNGPSYAKKDGPSKPRKNRGRKSEAREPVQEEKTYTADTAEALTYSSLAEGTIVLGRIHETTEYDMIVSLPGRLSGRVQATDVSRSYTNLLRGIVNSEDGKIDEFKPLSELYSRGKFVVCCVKNVSPGEKWRISLSLEPELINRNLDPGKLEKGSKIVGTVSSVEEHGYVIDTGIDDFRCFLALKDIEQGVTYHPGKQLFCAVKRLESSTTAQLTTKAKHVGTATTNDGQSLDAQIPGNKFVLTVQKVLRDGLRVSFNRDNVGYVNRMYLDESLRSYERGTEVRGILMYVMPTLKFAYFTLLSSDENKERPEVGDTFDKARVAFVERKGVVVILKKGIRGFVPVRRTDVPYDKISSKFAIGTAHRCRVLAYDLFEQIYVCTMERELLNEKHFATSKLEPGERLRVEIAKIQPETGYLMVTAGRTKGWVPPEHAGDPEIPEQRKFVVGQVVDARVLGRDKKQKGVLFTLKKSLVESTLPIVRSVEDAKIGGKHHGTVVQTTNKGILVRFYDHAKGWLSSRSLAGKTAANLSNFMIGQTIAVKIDSVKRDVKSLCLSLYTESKRVTGEANFKIGDNVEGIVLEASVEGIYVRITSCTDEPVTGFLPAGHMSPCREIGSYLAARFTSGDQISALVFSIEPRFLLTRTFVPNKKYRNFKKLNVGDCLPCSIHEIDEDGLKLILPITGYDSYGEVMRCNVENIDSLFINEILFARVTSINRKNRSVSLATSLHGVWNDNSSKHENDLIASVDLLTLYLSGLRELSEHDYYRSKPINGVKIGEKVMGKVEKVTDYGLVLKLKNDVTGTVRSDHYTGIVKPGDTVSGTILWINYIHELAEITLLPTIINALSTKPSNATKISTETQLRADIVLVTNWFVLVVLKGSGKGSLAALPTRRHINDVRPDLTAYSIGKRIRCYVVLDKTETDLLPICLVKSSFETAKIARVPAKKDLKRKRIDNDDLTKVKTKKTKLEIVEKGEKKKLNNIRAKEASTILDADKKVEEKLSKKRKLAKKTTELEPNVQSSASVELEKKKRKKLKRDRVAEPDTHIQNGSPESEQVFTESDEDNTTENLSGIPECGFFWDNKPDVSLVAEKESSSEDNDDDDDGEAKKKNKKKKKLSAAERREAERQKEREIRQREEALACNEAPNSVDQFDRLVLASPDSSMIWLQYMAHHLQATEIEKARAVAKRAIKTINFREETERLNVWQAWLNLESRFGSPESLESVFQDAVRTNDARSVYLHMLTVHADAGRQAELEKIVTTILGKFKQVALVWYECGAAFLKIGLKDKSRHIMQRALQSLPPQEHVNLMVKFAQLESKYGEKERAQTLFEQVLSSYPKRVDVWSSYVDALVKSSNIDTARKVLEKAVLQTLPARKMKTLFKKFVDFEQKHGSPEGVSHVQQLALKYVDNQCNKDAV